MLPATRRPRALAVLIGAALVVSSCGNVVHPAAAVVDGVRITDGQLRSTIPVLRFLAQAQQARCGEAGAGEAQDAACTRFALSELIQGQAARSFAASHHISIPHSELANAIVSVEQRFGGHSGLIGQLAHAHVSFPEFSDLVSTILLVERVARAVTAQVIPDQRLQSRYHLEQVKFTVIHVAHILVGSESLAAQIARRATPGNFAALARKYSKDPGSAPKGGDLGVNRASTLDPTFVKAALSLQPGEISGPVQTQFGWHVIRLLSVRVIPFAQAKPELLGEFTAEGFTTWLGRDAGNIDVNPRYGRFDPSTGRVAQVCSTSTTTPCPTPTPTPS